MTWNHTRRKFLMQINHKMSTVLYFVVIINSRMKLKSFMKKKLENEKIEKLNENRSNCSRVDGKEWAAEVSQSESQRQKRRKKKNEKRKVNHPSFLDIYIDWQMQPKVQVKLRIEEKSHAKHSIHLCSHFKVPWEIWLRWDVLSFASFLWPKLEFTIGWITCKICRTLRADEINCITP